MKKIIKSVGFFYNEKNRKASFWAKEIKDFIANHNKTITFVGTNPDVVFVLGGDGMMIRAAKHYNYSQSLFLGLNLGKVGFLTSVRNQKDFLKAVTSFLKGDYIVSQRSLIRAEVIRNNEVVFKDNVLNEVVVQSLLGMVNLDVKIDGFPFQNIYGTGALVSTTTGSTAYNLSAHGPLVMPNIECMILRELMDHNIPTPSLVVSKDKKITLDVIDFRKKDIVKIKQGANMVPADVLLISDGQNLFSLEKGDKVLIKNNVKKIDIVEFERDYFLSSLKNKFYIK